MKGLGKIQVARLSRENCVRLLESISIQCYDSEPLHVLRDAIKANIADGTISRQALETVSS